MSRHHGDRQSSGAGIDTCFRNRSRAHRERQPARRGKRARLRRRELRRIEIGEGIALERRTEIQDGGIALAPEHERGTEILISLDPLRVRHLQRPLRGDDLTEDGERPFDLEPLV